MTLNDIPKSEWTRYLSACVSLKANKVLSNLSLEDNLSYDVCKKAVLSYYCLDSTSYQRKFRESKRNSDESFKMLRQRLKDLSYFCESKGINSYESLLMTCWESKYVPCLTQKQSILFFLNNRRVHRKCVTMLICFWIWQKTLGTISKKGLLGEVRCQRATQNRTPLQNQQSSRHRQMQNPQMGGNCCRIKRH